MGIEDYSRRTAPGRDGDQGHTPGVLHKNGEEVIVDPDLKAEAEAKAAEAEEPSAA